MGKRGSKVDIDQLAKLLAGPDRLTYDEIGQLFGVSRQRVCQLAKKHTMDIGTKRKKKEQPGSRSVHLPVWYADVLSTKEVRAAAGVSLTTAIRWLNHYTSLKRFNKRTLKTRSRAAAMYSLRMRGWSWAMLNEEFGFSVNSCLVTGRYANERGLELLPFGHRGKWRPETRGAKPRLVIARAAIRQLVLDNRPAFC
jgi:hypothetical protein